MPDTGGNGLAMRAGFLLDAYSRHFDVDLAVIPVAATDAKVTDFVRARVRRVTTLSLAQSDTHFVLVSAVADPEARLVAFRHYFRPSLMARLTNELQRALMAWAADEPYALVHISRLYLAEFAAPWLKRGRRTPGLVLDCDEDDAGAYRSLAAVERRWGRGAKAGWAEAEAAAFNRLATEWLPRFDLVLASSEGEARSLRARISHARVSVVPNVAPPVQFRIRPQRLRSDRTVIFVGTMSYAPNVDAVLWFASRIWPRLRLAVPFQLRFIVVGQGAGRRVMRLGQRTDMIVTGRVPDVAPYYRAADLAVVPIRAGGGTRVKLLESATYGVPVVATRFGAAGTNFRSDRELILADDEIGFTRACARVLNDGKLGVSLASRAYRRVRNDHDAERSAGRLALRLLALVGGEYPEDAEAEEERGR